METLKHPYGQSDFGSEATAAFGPLGVIESSSEGQKSVFIEQSRQNPLVAEDIRQVLGMILIPSTTGNLLSRFFEDRIIQEEKDDRAGFNPKGMEEFLQSNLQDLIHGPRIFSQEASEAGERSAEKGAGQGLDHGGGMGFFAQLDETGNKRGEESKRRS